jgi:transposase InsO family protein
MPGTTVSGILRRIGLGRRGRLGLEPAQRYERQRPGELLHIDVRRLGRILVPGHAVTGNRRQRARRTTYTPDGRRLGDAGWEYVCVDDATRLAYAEVLPDEKATTAAGFLRRAVAFYRDDGIAVEAVLTDNGPGYRSALHALCCRTLGIKHLRTRPYRPQTNGKAERFIRTMLGEWAYGGIYGSSSGRTAALAGFLRRYNFRRNHGALGRKPPAARLAELNNALGSYS